MSFENFHPVEFRPGESTENNISKEEERRKFELERTKNFTNADYAEEFFADILTHTDSYSETFKIKDDGNFDGFERLDGSPVNMHGADTADELYKLAKDIQDKHPEYQFNFENDPEGKWLKYTVSKKKLESASHVVEVEPEITISKKLENTLQIDEKLKEERRHSIIKEIEKKWEDENGPLEQPMTYLEIEAQKFIAQKNGKEWDGRTTRLTDKAADFWFAFSGGLSVPEKADRLLIERFPEYAEKKK